jgi:hypothetical protein
VQQLLSKASGKHRRWHFLKADKRVNCFLKQAPLTGSPVFKMFFKYILSIKIKNYNMGLFRLSKLLLFLIFLLPILILSQRQQNALSLAGMVFSIAVINAMFVAKNLNDNIKSKLTLSRFYSEGIVVVLNYILILVMPAFHTLMNDNSFTGALISIFNLVMFIHFSSVFTALVYAHINKVPTVWNKFLIFISLVIFPLGVFYIKGLLKPNAKGGKVLIS